MEKTKGHMMSSLLCLSEQVKSFQAFVSCVAMAMPRRGDEIIKRVISSSLTSGGTEERAETTDRTSAGPTETNTISSSLLLVRTNPTQSRLLVSNSSTAIDRVWLKSPSDTKRITLFTSDGR